VRKLIHRHPHVFGGTEVSGADEVLLNWERLKQQEATGAARDPAAVDEHIPESLPALARAAKVQRRAASHGFDWRGVDGALAALREEVDELDAELARDDAFADRVEAEVGDVLFAAVAVARKAGVDAESALRRTIGSFADRYARFVALAAERGIDVEGAPEDELRALFREARDV
jgi:MazG family protein